MRMTVRSKSNEDDKQRGNSLRGMLIPGEPDAGKACAMSRTEGIVTTGDRSSRQLTPRRTTYLTLKGGGDRSMLVKRGIAEDVYAIVLQRLRGCLKSSDGC
jgi:hypothetical protein